ncbi:SDR family oxidoreductase [Agromyces albus]|uniref:gluconokinase n=2 Tax=Agromyces albus TaxID=205332 RepID=A0A4Q2KTW8_9MICO|nr:SDR family oxidoreductase [Agromyces albus]
MAASVTLSGRPVVVMGVSGSGKTTVGSRLARELDRHFLDGDDLHPRENRAKMAAGIPLDDDDRRPWLEEISLRLRSGDDAGHPLVIACSALKRSYRDILTSLAPSTVFVHLAGDPAVIGDRMRARDHEFMPATLLASQVAVLEPLGDDEGGVVIDITRSPDDVVGAALAALASLETPEAQDAPERGLFDLTGRMCLVTGSSRGIGNVIARGLADAGATVVLNGVDPGRLAAARENLAATHGDRIHARAFDVTDQGAVADAVAAIEAELGPVGVLVNNAGIQHREPLLDVSVEDWNRVLTTDLTSAFLVGREVARSMIARGRGKIINIASVQADLARPSIGPYTAAKGGLRNLTRAMTAEWAGAGLQINAIAPGYIHTEMTQPLVDDPEFNAFILRRTPAARWGATRDLVGPAVWLASDGSDFVNGQVIFVDGGMTVIV